MYSISCTNYKMRYNEILVENTFMPSFLWVTQLTPFNFQQKTTIPISEDARTVCNCRQPFCYNSRVWWTDRHSGQYILCWYSHTIKNIKWKVKHLSQLHFVENVTMPSAQRTQKTDIVENAFQWSQKFHQPHGSVLESQQISSIRTSRIISSRKYDGKRRSDAMDGRDEPETYPVILYRIFSYKNCRLR